MQGFPTFSQSRTTSGKVMEAQVSNIFLSIQNQQKKKTQGGPRPSLREQGLCNHVIQPPLPCKTFCFACLHQPALCRKCVFVLWTSCLRVKIHYYYYSLKISLSLCPMTKELSESQVRKVAHCTQSITNNNLWMEGSTNDASTITVKLDLIYSLKRLCHLKVYSKKLRFCQIIATWMVHFRNWFLHVNKLLISKIDTSFNFLDIYLDFVQQARLLSAENWIGCHDRL